MTRCISEKLSIAMALRLSPAAEREWYASNNYKKNCPNHQRSDLFFIMSYCDQRSSQRTTSQLIGRPYESLSPLGEKSKDQSAYLVNRRGATAAQNSASVWRMRHYLIQARRRSRLELIHLLPATDSNARLARRVGTANRVLVESPLSDLLNLMWTSRY